jgi:hypothetical protein
LTEEGALNLREKIGTCSVNAPRRSLNAIQYDSKKSTEGRLCFQTRGGRK